MRGPSGRWMRVVPLVALGCAAMSAVARADEPPPPGRDAWRGVHMMAPDPRQIPLLERAIDEMLRPLGVNAIILEINYNFNFRSHPEIGGGWSAEQARGLARYCRERGIRLIPQLNCLGHQSWEKHIGPLLTAHPEFDETPQIPRDNPGIYCRSWCPLHPDVNKVVFALIDELADAFEADAFHVGMDEVFLIGSDQCPRCKGKDPAELFAKAVNDLHGHIVGERKLHMLMWGDRLIDAKATGYGEWEASRNGTAPAIDLIPRDIIVCDWHYEPLDKYEGKPDRYRSVGYFQEKGFRVWPAGWRNRDAALALRAEARRAPTDRMIGYLATTWTDGATVARALLGENGDRAREAVESMRACFGTASTKK